MSDERKPSRGLPNTWLELSGGLGRFGGVFLIMQHLLLLLAPIFFMANLRAQLPPGRTTMEDLFILLSAPDQLVYIADLLAIPGIIFVSVALLLTLLGLKSERAGINPVLTIVGLAAFASLVLWVPTTLYSQGRAAGAILTLDEVAATGGFTVASALILLGASLWMAFTLGVQKEMRTSGLTSLHWPVYAAVNVFGAAAIAAFVQSLVAGAPSQDSLILGVILKATLIPVLGVIAYANLRDRFYVVKMLRFAPREEPAPRERKVPSPPPPGPPAPAPEPLKGSASPSAGTRAATARR